MRPSLYLTAEPVSGLRSIEDVRRSIQSGYGKTLWTRQLEAAEAAYLRALQLEPRFVGAAVNLADLYRGQQRDEEAEAILRKGLKNAADRGAVEFALGLTLVRLERHAEALTHLERAHELRPEVIRFGYVYAVAQFDQGQQDAALETLGRMNQRYPANRDILRLLIGYNQQMGRTKAAERYSAQLGKLGGSP